jgi:glycosyltransferase involved in cell wall biosynthesis
VTSPAVGPSVSVVIPTYDRLPLLRRVLAALSEQTYPDVELVVVSDGSTDGTDEYLRSDAKPANVVYVLQTNAGPAAARNTGVRVATGAIVLFVDDDVVASPQLVEQHVSSHCASSHLGGRTVVIGPMVTPDDHDMSAWVRWEQQMLYKQYDAMDRGDWAPTYRQFYTGNASVPRASLLELGGFDTTFRRAEDVELAFRLDGTGHRFVFNRNAVGYHYAERSFTSWLQIAQDYGTNDVVFAREHDRPELLEIMGREFRQRSRFVRWPAQACAALPFVGRLTRTTLSAAARAADRAGFDRGARMTLSSLYSIAYYGAAAQQLGGGRAFRRVVR